MHIEVATTIFVGLQLLKSLMANLPLLILSGNSLALRPQLKREGIPSKRKRIIMVVRPKEFLHYSALMMAAV